MKKLLKQRNTAFAKRTLKHLDRMEAFLLGLADAAATEQYLPEYAGAAAADVRESSRAALFSGGKRLRPALVFVSAAGFGTARTDDIVPLMAILELMHNGSLVHDDVVDQSALRRGQKTVNAAYGDHIAVQSGDYVLAKSMPLLRKYRGTGIDSVLADTAEQMCLGELRQLKAERGLEEQTEERYFERIRSKTACLIAAACQTGAIAAGLPEEWQRALRAYGLAFGAAFQLRDDLLDYDIAAGPDGDESEKKPAFQDIKRGIYTLPLLYALREKPNGAPPFADIASRRGDRQTLIQWIEDAGGFAYAEAAIDRFVKAAAEHLEALPDGEAKRLLIETARAGSYEK